MARNSSADVGTEQLRAGLEAHAFRSRSDRDWVEAEVIDERDDRGDVVRIVVGDRDGFASPRSCRPWLVFEVVVPPAV